MRIVLSYAATRRERRIARLRVAQAAGDACVVCGKRWPRPTVAMYSHISAISGFGCPECAPSSSLPPGATQ